MNVDNEIYSDNRDCASTLVSIIPSNREVDFAIRDAFITDFLISNDLGGALITDFLILNDLEDAFIANRVIDFENRSALINDFDVFTN